MSNTYFNISDKLRLYEFDGMLDQYGDAAAAYSLRKLRNGYTGNAIRVRRSSDDAERDMGFYDNELDTVALLNWVNTDYIKAQWDFSVGGTNLSTLNLPQSNGESVAGENASHYCYGGPTIPGQTFTVAGRYYIPSTNVSCNAIRISGGSSEFEFFNTLDQWAEFEVTTSATLTYAIFRAADGTNTNIGGDGDVFYLKDVVITQNTSDGLVQTWYDQSANANHAVQNTDAAQPKIVDAGTLVTGGGKPTILYDDVDDVLELTSEVVTTDAFRHFIVCDNDADGRVYDSAGQPDNLLIQSYRYILRVNNTAITINSNTGRDKNIIEAGRDSSDAVDFVVNDSTLSSGTVISGQSKLAQIGSSTSHYGGTIYEVITYNSDATISSLDISGIRGNINTQYSIY